MCLHGGKKNHHGYCTYISLLDKTTAIVKFLSASDRKEALLFVVRYRLHYVQLHTLQKTWFFFSSHTLTIHVMLKVYVCNTDLAQRHYVWNKNMQYNMKMK